MGHETHRISSELGAAPASCCGVVKEEGRDSSDCPTGPSITWSCAPLDSRLEEARRQGARCQAHAGAAQEADRQTAREASDAPPRWRTGLWVSQRAVDVAADGDGDSSGVRGAVPPEPSVARPARVWVELSGARAPSDSARRGRHRALAAAQVARNKKKLEDLGPTSPSSMRVGSC